MFVFYHWMDYFCFVCVCFFLMWKEFLSEKIALNQKISLKMKFTCKTVNEIVHQLCFLLSKVWEILFPPSLLLDLRLLSSVLVFWLLLSVFLTNKNCIELATRRKISNLSAKLFAYLHQAVPVQPFCDHFRENYLHGTIYRSLLNLQNSTIGKKIEFAVDIHHYSITFTDFSTERQQVNLPAIMRKYIKVSFFAALKSCQQFFNQ